MIWWLVACGGSTGDLGPRELESVLHTFWAEGDWYDLGRVGLLMTTSGEADCEDFLEPVELRDDPLSTLYEDEGTFTMLVWERVDVPADSGLEPPAEFTTLEGLWTVTGDGPGWRSWLDVEVFHDGQLTPAIPSETWLRLDRTADPGPVVGELSTGQVALELDAEHCGELIAYRVF